MEADPRELAFALSRGLVDLCRDRIELLAFEDTTTDALAAAALARVISLSDAARLLEEVGSADCAGVMVRCALDAHDLGVYALLGGEEAESALWDDHEHNANRVHKNLREHFPVFFDDDDAVPDDDRSKKKRLTMFELNRRAMNSLEASGEPLGNAGAWYEVVSRFYSTYSVHGLGSVLSYLDADTQPMRLRARAAAPGPEFLVTALLVGHLAALLFPRLDGVRYDDVHTTFVVLKGVHEQIDVAQRDLG